MDRSLNTGITGIKFKNNHVVYENITKCTVKDYEYNLSYNPTLLSGSQGLLVPYSASNGDNIVYVNSGSNYGILKDFTTGSISGSEFSPYVGSIGLYNDAGDLLAVAKMAAPIPLSINTDTTFLIKYDTQWLPKPYFTPSPTPSVTPFSTPSITPTISVTPSVTPSVFVDCNAGTAVGVFVPSVTPSVTPTISVTPSITVTPSVTPTISVSKTPGLSPTPSKTPTPTPTRSVQSQRVTLTFEAYAGNQAAFTLSSPLPTTLTITEAQVVGYNNLSCLGFNGLTSNIPTATLVSGNTLVSVVGNNPFSLGIVSYKRTNSMKVNGITVSNGSVINVGGISVSIVINTGCTRYL